MRRMTPIASLLAGAAAGVLASVAQDLFLAATSKVAPEAPQDAFTAPEWQQSKETPPQTIGRRTFERLLTRGPMANKELAGKIVDYAYGGAWGAVYGLLAESYPDVRTLGGGLAYGAGLWAVSENVILPLFRLRAWPQRYPWTIHAYGLAAHLVYGAALWGAFEAARRRSWVKLFALVTAAWSTRRAPHFMRAPLRKAVKTVREVESAVENAVSP